MSLPESPRSIGEPQPLIDGPDKVSGKAMFAADFKSHTQLVGRILRSPTAHAYIKSIDISAAEALDGVAAVATSNDCSDTYGVLVISMNEWALAKNRVRYCGEPVAAVAAATVEIAQKALDLIKVEYEELPAYFSAEDARSVNAVLLHEERPGNIEREVDFDLGDVNSDMEKSHLIREVNFHCAEVCQVQTEPHATFAEYDASLDMLTVRPSTQVPYYVHKMLARTLGMSESRIRVIKPHIGGGFGCRTETLQCELIAAILARKSGQAVSLVLSREENFITHRGRPESDIRMKIGMRKDGRVMAVDFDAVQRGGAYSGYGVVTILYAGSLLYGIYDIKSARFNGLRVLTNTPPCGAFRGHGTVKTRFAFESLLDEMGCELGLDPFEVRRVNLLSAPTITENDLLVNSYGLDQCLNWVEEASKWRERLNKMPPNKGLGMACSHYISGASKPKHWTGEPHATVQLKLDWDGAITLLTGAAEIGQGSSTVLAQCAAEVLAVDVSTIRVVAADSALTPKDNGSYSSRVTYMVGNAVIDAANNLKAVLIKAAANRLEIEPSQVECLGDIYRGGKANNGIAFQEVVMEALKGEGTITVKGKFDTIPESWGGKKYRGAAIGGTMAFSYAAQVVEVTVDPDTCEITVDKVWVAHDCGRALNPLAVEGQVQGSVWMGMGQAISEETKFFNGLPLSANMLDYRVPTIIESPPIEVKIIEAEDPHGPFGAKEAGEGSLSGFLPAFTNAVANAVGVRATELPLTPDRLLELLKDKRGYNRILREVVN